MKRVLFTLIALICLISQSNGQVSGIVSQKVPSEVVQNVDADAAIQIIESVCHEFAYQIAEFDPVNMIVTTEFFEWTSVAVKNRGKLRFEYQDNQIIVSIINREYASGEGWTEVSTKLSKKNITKYITTTCERIAFVAADEGLKELAIWSSALIRHFKPVINIDGLEWRFVKGKENVEFEKLKSPNYVVELTVTNTLSDVQTIRLQGSGLWPKSEPDQDGGITHYSLSTFGVLEEKTVTTVELQPNESKTVFVYYSNLSEERKVNPIGCFVLNYALEKDGVFKIKKTLHNHTMPVPFENIF